MEQHLLTAPLSILLIEGNVKASFLFIDTFKDEAMISIEVVRSLESGVKRLKEDVHFDVVICDLNLPDSNYKQTLNLIEKMRFTPIILWSNEMLGNPKIPFISKEKLTDGRSAFKQHVVDVISETKDNQLKDLIVSFGNLVDKIEKINSQLGSDM